MASVTMPSCKKQLEDFIDECGPAIERGLGGKESVKKTKWFRLDLQQRDGDKEVYNLQVQLNHKAMQDPHMSKLATGRGRFQRDRK